jgi:hypothetical protein
LIEAHTRRPICPIPILDGQNYREKLDECEIGEMKKTNYKYSGLTLTTFESAQKIAPLISNIIGVPEFVVDLGGGDDGWLKGFKIIGTKKVCCIDHPSIKAEDLLIDENDLVRCDLSKEILSPVKCDLVISLANQLTTIKPLEVYYVKKILLPREM